MMPPFLNPTGAVSGGKTLETLQTELKKVRFDFLTKIFLIKNLFI